eukprot:CFRG2961T1
MIAAPGIETGAIALRDGKEEMPDIAVTNWVQYNFARGANEAIPHAVVCQYFSTYCSAYNYRVCTSTHLGAAIRQEFPNTRVCWVADTYCFFGLKIRQESLFRLPLNKLGYPMSLPIPSLDTIDNKDTNGLAQHPLFPDFAHVARTTEDIVNAKQMSLPCFTHPEIRSDDSLYRAHATEFLAAYKSHLEQTFMAICTTGFSVLENLWMDFWTKTPFNPSISIHSPQQRNIITRDMLMSSEPVLSIMTIWEREFYEGLVRVLFPRLTGPLHSTVMKSIRDFIRHAPKAMMTAMQSLPPDVGVMKLNHLDKYAICLQRQLSIDNLCQALRAVLQDEEIVDQMSFDWSCIDFSETVALARNLYGAQGVEIISSIQFGLTDLLDDLPYMEDYLSWLTKLLNKTLVKTNGPISVIESNEVLMQWTFLFSAIIRDLTLRSASSFGHFHLLRLLLDEYVAHTVDTYKRERLSQELFTKVWGKEGKINTNVPDTSKSNNYTSGNEAHNRLHTMKDASDVATIYDTPHAVNMDNGMRLGVGVSMSGKGAK